MNPSRELDTAERIARDIDELDELESALTRNLLEAILARLDDERTLSDRKLRRSLDEMRSGELTDITPRAGV